jgi:hypothetical protein
MEVHPALSGRKFNVITLPHITKCIHEGGGGPCDLNFRFDGGRSMESMESESDNDPSEYDRSDLESQEQLSPRLLECRRRWDA